MDRNFTKENNASPHRQGPDLPPEIWLEVFSFLDYFTLTRGIPLVCKNFSNLLIRTSNKSRSEVDKLLFREYISFPTSDFGHLKEDGEITKKEHSSKYRLHPFFFDIMHVKNVLAAPDEVLHVVFDQSECQPVFLNPDRPSTVELKLEDFARTIEDNRNVWHENSTSPPINSIILTAPYKVEVCGDNIVKLPRRIYYMITTSTDNKAVTVLDVLIAGLVLFRYRDNPMFDFFEVFLVTPYRDTVRTNKSDAVMDWFKHRVKDRERRRKRWEKKGKLSEAAIGRIETELSRILAIDSAFKAS